MKTTRKVGLLILIWVASFANVQQAQTPSRLNDKEVESLLKRLEGNADRFRESSKEAFDKSHLNGTKKEDRAKQYVKDFAAATDHLKDRFSKNNSAAGDVEEVLKRAAKIDDFMTRDILDSRAQNDWKKVRGNLDELAGAYGVSWNWNGRPYSISQIHHDDEGMRSLVDRIERDSNRFRDSLKDALDKEHFEDVRGEDHILQLVEDFETATDRLRDRFTSNDSVPGDVEDVLRRAARIDRFMMRNSLDARTQDDWTVLRRDLDELAQVHRVAWKW